MDKQNKNLLVAGAVALGLLAYSFLRKGRTLKNLNFAIKGIDLDLKQKTASVELRIINPTKDQITLNSIVCDLIVNDEAIGTVKFLKDQVKKDFNVELTHSTHTKMILKKTKFK